MHIISADMIDQALDPVTLADALADGFRSDIILPLRHHHDIERDGQQHGEG